MVGEAEPWWAVPGGMWGGAMPCQLGFRTALPCQVLRLRLLVLVASTEILPFGVAWSA